MNQLCELGLPFMSLSNLSCGQEGQVLRYGPFLVDELNRVFDASRPCCYAGAESSQSEVGRPMNVAGRKRKADILHRMDWC